jgi:hypothetical protein
MAVQQQESHAARLDISKVIEGWHDSAWTGTLGWKVANWA